MKFHFKGDRFLGYFFFCLGTLLVTLLLCLLFLRHIEVKQSESAEIRYESYLLADELRQSSDDLTSMVRMYVITGKKRYRDQFNEILAIRNGISPRPLQYHQIYWDLVLDDNKRPRPLGVKTSLQELMLKQGFTLEEFNLLGQAQNKSDDLAILEITAMNAIEGKFDDGSGKFLKNGLPDPELARKLIFSDEYMQIKAQIMAPLQQFFDHVEARTKKESHRLATESLFVVIVAIALAAISTIIMLISIAKALKALSKITLDNEMLLLNILPSPIADRLKGGEEPIADEYPQASVLFADIVGFTELTYKLGAKKMVAILNELFAELDLLTEKFGVEKIKTIGDNYMAVSGIPIPTTDHAIRLADYALAVRVQVEEFNKKRDMHLQVRIGMTYGTVIAGVIGHKKFIYDLWGDVINIASRMESTGVEGEIQITEKMAMMLDELFVIECRGDIDVKGRGIMKTFFLKSRKS